MKKYLGNSRFGSVYEEDNGVPQAGGYDMEPCKFCSRWIIKCYDHECDGCWEITSRLKDFVRLPAGRKLVEECLEETK